jgi:hypothetical protein
MGRSIRIFPQSVDLPRRSAMGSHPEVTDAGFAGTSRRMSPQGSASYKIEAMARRLHFMKPAAGWWVVGWSPNIG